VDVGVGAVILRTARGAVYELSPFRAAERAARHFMFQSHATAFGGRIVRPIAGVIESGGASALTASGGRSTWQSGPVKFGNYMSVGKAAALTQGLHESGRELAVGGMVGVSSVPIIQASASVRNIEVGPGPKLTVREIVGAVRQFGDTRLPYSPIETETKIRGLSLSGHRLEVEFVDLRKDVPLSSPPDPKPVTIVGRLAWVGSPFPGAVIDRHTVAVPDFGRIFIGEVVLARGFCRLTMLRLELGSPMAGSISFCDVEAGGLWLSS
jgi:hypothetical protein